MWSFREYIGIISLPLRYNAARERASAMVEGARLRLRRPVSSLRAYVGWAAFDMRMMFQGYLERGFVAEEGDTETLTKLLGHPPRRYEGFARETAEAWQPETEPLFRQPAA